MTKYAGGLHTEMCKQSRVFGEMYAVLIMALKSHPINSAVLTLLCELFHVHFKPVRAMFSS